MAEQRALSQHEIDALLSQIPGDDAPRGGGGEGALRRDAGPQQRERVERAIKAYDFRRPDKFSKEQWQSIHAMHEQYARLVGVMFSQRLRTLVAVRLSSISQGLYEEWQAQVPSQTVSCVFSLPPLDGNLVVEFNMDVAAEVVDRLLGGTAVLLDRTRELGEIELLLLRSFASSVIGSVLQQMWSNLAPVQPMLQDIVLDAGHVQIAGQNDVAIISFFEVNLGNHLGAMSVCTPYTVVEPVASKFSAQVWLSQGGAVKRDERTRSLLDRMLRAAPLEVAVRLGGVDLPARTVAALQPGDTLVLDTRVQDPLTVIVGEHERFRGRPGLVGNHVGISVTEVVPRPEDADTVANGPPSPLAQFLRPPAARDEGGGASDGEGTAGNMRQLRRADAQGEAEAPDQQQRAAS